MFCGSIIPTQKMACEIKSQKSQCKDVGRLSGGYVYRILPINLFAAEPFLGNGQNVPEALAEDTLVFLCSLSLSGMEHFRTCNIFSLWKVSPILSSKYAALRSVRN